MNHEQNRRDLMLTNPDASLVEGFDRAIDTGSLLKSEECPVLDASGTPLVKGGKYQFQNKTIRIERWEFGAGNILDRYYRVHYIDSDINDGMLVVDAKYPKGVFGGAVYPTELVRSDRT